MSTDAVHKTRPGVPRSELRDLDQVMLTAAVVTDDGDVIDAGTGGTVVGVWRDGAAYEVEFATPPGALATIEASALRLVRRPPS